MAFSCPVTEQAFVLDCIVGLASIGEGIDSDLVAAVLDGAAAFAEQVLEPLDRIGDTTGARFADGRVTMPPGFADAYRQLVDGGWTTITAPAEAGGQGLPLALAAAVMEDMQAANCGFALCPMLSLAAIEALTAFGSDELKRNYLPAIVSGRWPATMNLTEPQAGSDVGALRTRAAAAGDGSWRISGSKIFITYGEHDLADNIVQLVLARTSGAPEGTRGISLFLVPKMLPGGRPNDVVCRSIEHKLGIHASPTCVIDYGSQGEGAIGWLVGEDLGGMRAMFTMMNNARLNVALQGVGIAERATQRAVGFALERVQSARAGAASRDPVAIAEHPDVRRMLLRMRSLTMGARALCYYAFGQIDRARHGDGEGGLRSEILTPLAKAWATDIGCEVASLGIQVHGGMGYIEESGAAQHLRDARIAPIYEGTNGIQAADLVARKLALDGGAAFDSLIADIRSETEAPALIALTDAVEITAATLRAATVDDRLAASYPFLTMTAVLVAGWLMERQGRAAAGRDETFFAAKRAAVDYFTTAIVPEALGLAAAAESGAALLYSVPAEALA